jgi:hypothetical protein
MEGGITTAQETKIAHPALALPPSGWNACKTPYLGKVIGRMVNG